jgi:hypothetical protein
MLDLMRATTRHKPVALKLAKSAPPKAVSSKLAKLAAPKSAIKLTAVSKRKS